MKLRDVYDAFISLEMREYNEAAGDVRRSIAKLLEKSSVKFGLFSAVDGKPFGFINTDFGDSVFIHSSIKGYTQLNDGFLTWATVAKTEKGYRATSCGTIGNRKEFSQLLDKYNITEEAERIVIQKNTEIDEEENRWKKFQEEQAAKKAAAIARAEELSGGYREVVTYSRNTYGGAFSATYYVEREDMTMDEFKEFIACLGHKVEAKPCNIPIKPEKVEIKQTSSNSWSYDWTGEWDD